MTTRCCGVPIHPLIPDGTCVVRGCLRCDRPTPATRSTYYIFSTTSAHATSSIMVELCLRTPSGSPLVSNASLRTFTPVCHTTRHLSPATISAGYCDRSGVKIEILQSCTIILVTNFVTEIIYSLILLSFLHFSRGNLWKAQSQ